MDKYSAHEKRDLFNKIQQYVKDQKLTTQNMVDLHDILTNDKPSYSHNKNGTMYMSNKYSDDTFEKIEELLKWIDKQHTHVESTSSSQDTKGGVEGSTDMSHPIDGSNIDFESNDENQQESFGQNKKFKNTFGTSRFKLQKNTDVTKLNESFKRIIKKSKKRTSIPIHHLEKDLTAWEDSFSHTRNCHFSEYYMSRNVDDDANECDDIDSDEDDEEEEEEEDLLYDQFREEEEEEEEEEVEEASVDLDEEDDDLGDEDVLSE